jgi:hypothetical protein
LGITVYCGFDFLKFLFAFVWFGERIGAGGGAGRFGALQHFFFFWRKDIDSRLKI